MDPASTTDSAKAGTRLTAYLVSLLVLLLVGDALGWFDTTTELAPSHDLVLQFCFVIAGMAALICGGLLFRESRGMEGWRRVPVGFGLVVMGFFAVFLVSSRSADIIEGLIDFPAAKTKTYPRLLLIWRAYQTHGKGRSWNIQTTPIWSNLDITEQDYDFMQTHRALGDHGRNPDEISSHGFFCARVTMQQSGKALRILHAGSQKLPAGTVMVCPSEPLPPTLSKP